ncbi:hypothetical protein M407DRAFT_33153 [Tulasnella calospora MUT 4182]|uniref:Uncharacterized protein n=1 Tax=Tulasnella calospora MUT 4182 TaxID=1051891 RepID=A0A0C3PRD5_9AGAM|nr:hypothetical protein M407DRAFT_33153 [Tulasnella calospora MUT 4182]
MSYVGNSYREVARNHRRRGDPGTENITLVSFVQSRSSLSDGMQMQSRVVFFIDVVLDFVVLCVLCIVVLRRVILRAADWPTNTPTFIFGLHVLGVYTNLVRTTLDWLEAHHIPINSLARTVIGELLANAHGAQGAPHASSSPEQQSNHQTQDLVVPFDLQRPPPAYF